ncbi:tryptophan 2,3-dioxygenase family protein [Streptomyces sp. NPDC048483]|uniref:tryptophan 2,3-dioxygenase family protein n=1 Tax=Streptomyces sp. NPDC048483 TaxID=3154927 RepID=UPI00342B4F75
MTAPTENAPTDRNDLAHGNDLTPGNDPTYGDYLRLSDLLDLHVPRCVPAHDEHLFITVHQVHELWFQLLLHELADARERMMAGEICMPRIRLRRCHAIERALFDTMQLLDTMTPKDFLAFRGGLGTASGAQSAQFHEIEILSGRQAPPRLDRMPWLTAAERTRLERRVAQPSLWDGFLTVLAKAGFGVDTAEERHTAYAEITRDPAHHALNELAEALLDHDQAWALWRTRHVLVVERQIGGKPGTGGSTGVSYLAARAGARFFPELWQFRLRLT